MLQVFAQGKAALRTCVFVKLRGNVQQRDALALVGTLLLGCSAPMGHKCEQD